MKKLLMVLGGMFLSLLVAGGGVFGYAASKISKLNAESQSYVEATVPKILSNPSAENFMSFVASKDKANIDPAALPRFSSFININLGALRGCEDIRGGSLQNFAPSGETITATYSARCRFNKASIQATIVLRKLGDAWSVVSLYLNADTLRAERPTAVTL